MTRALRVPSRLVPRWSRILLASAITFTSGVAISNTPVTADCGADGVQWPSAPSDVQGVAFIGTVTGEAPTGPATGPTLVRFVVDTLLDGNAGGVVWLEPWCVGTEFRTGERYLVSSSDRLPLGDYSPTPSDGQVWFTDPYAVAWHLPGGGKAVLQGYGDGTLRDAPRWLEGPSSWDQAAAAVLPDPSSPVRAVTNMVEDGTLRLTLMTDRATYTASDAIRVAATLEMLRTEPTTIVGSGSGPVLFGIEQLDGPVDAGPIATADCAFHVWAPGQTAFVPFEKSVGYDMDDPTAPFWTAFMNEPDLVLPAGHYRIFAQVEYDIDDCTAHSSELLAEDLVEVVALQASPGPL